MKHKKLFVSLTAIFTVVIFFSIFLMIWFLGDEYKDFDSFREEFEIPGLDAGAVPQGITTCTANYYVENEDVPGTLKPIEQQYYFISAYMTNKRPSRIYVVGEDTGYVGYVNLKTEDGKYFYGHCGGVAINNGNITNTSNAKYYTLWVTGDGMVYCAKASDEYAAQPKGIAQEIIEKAATHEAVTFTASFKAYNNADFCFFYQQPSSTGVTTNDALYVGEFYREGNYETDKSHWMTTPNGYLNKAVIHEYWGISSSTNKYGLSVLSKSDGIDGIAEEDLVPKIQAIISIPELIQGGALTGLNYRLTYSSTNSGILTLSESYGLSNSHLLCFDVKSLKATSTSYSKVTGDKFFYEGLKKTFGDQQMQDLTADPTVYFVDKNDEDMLINDYSIPSMAEGLCVRTYSTTNVGDQNRVFVLFESASKKYRLFTRQKVKSVYSFIPKATKKS